MRLFTRFLQAVTVHEPVANEDVHTFAPFGTPLLATIRPAESWRGEADQIREGTTGERPAGELMLYYEGPVGLSAGQGVRVEGISSTETPCDFRILSVAKWPLYQKAVLQRIARG